MRKEQVLKVRDSISDPIIHTSIICLALAFIAECIPIQLSVIKIRVYVCVNI